MDLNPDVCDAIKKYALSNLGQLSCEMVSQFIHTQIVPNMVKERRERNSTGSELLDEDEDETKAMLREYGLTQICISTVYRWLKKLGFSYEPWHKGYFVDGHEKEATVAYRYKFIHTYFQYELRTPRWIQIPEEEAKKMEENEEIPVGVGYCYNHPVIGVPMVEYHVDTHESFQKAMENETWLGGRRSVRYPSGKLLVILGHDEMIIKQYKWTGRACPKG